MYYNSDIHESNLSSLIQYISHNIVFISIFSNLFFIFYSKNSFYFDVLEIIIFFNVRHFFIFIILGKFYGICGNVYVRFFHGDMELFFVEKIKKKNESRPFRQIWS